MVDSPNQTGNRVGVEISNAALNAVVISENDSIITELSVVTGNAESTVTELIKLVETLKSEFGGFARIGIAVPGLVDRATGRVAFSANSPKHSGFDLVSDVKAATGLD